MDNLPSDDEFDEVSLPGVGDNEQATILEVLNRRIVSTEDGNTTTTGIEPPTKEEQHSSDTLNAIKVTSSTSEDELTTPSSKDKKSGDNLVSSSSSSRGQAEWSEPQRSQLIEDEENVFDIESHLIETLNNYSVSEDSESWGVDIKELPPAEGESLYRTSKIETDPSIGTVFEVEPATPKVLKPVATSVPEPQRQSGLAQKAQVEQNSGDFEVNKQPEPVSEGKQSQKNSKPVATSVPEPQRQSDQAQVDQISVDSEIQPTSVNESEKSKKNSEPVKATVPKSKKQSKRAQKAKVEQISVDSEIKCEVEQTKNSKEPVKTTVPEPQQQSGAAQVEQISVDSEAKDSNAERQTDSTEPVNTTVPEPQRQSEPAQFEQISADFEAKKQSESISNVEQPKEGTEPVEATVTEAQSGLPQNIDEAQVVVDAPFDDTKPIWNIVKDLQTDLEEAQVDSAVLQPQAELEEREECVDSKLEYSKPNEDTKSEVDSKKAQLGLATSRVDPIQEVSSITNEERVDPTVKSSKPNEHTKADAQLDLTTSRGKEVTSPVGQSNEVENPLETTVLKTNDSEESSDQTITKAVFATKDQKTDLPSSGEPVDSSKQVTPESTEKSVPEPPYEPLHKADPDSLNISSTTQVDDSDRDTHDTVDNAQSIDATKTQTDPIAPDPTVTAKTIVEKLLIGATIEKSNEDTKTDLLSKELEHTTPGVDDSASLTQEIDQQLSELATHLAGSSKVDLNGNIPKETSSSRLESEETALDVNGLPLPKTALEEEQRQQFLDSLPQISPETDSNKVAALAKREYYQSLRQYLITHSDKPPVPPETYRWEDLKRAKQRGGYPWTHLYKRPLGTDEEPEIVLLLRKSQELRFSSESPKSIKKVRIDDQVSIKETERYIQELSDIEDNPTTEDEETEHEDERSECISCVSDSVLTVEKRSSKLGKLRGILKKRSPKKESDSKSLPDTSSTPSTSLGLSRKSEEDISERPSRPLRESQNKAKCFPIMKKLKSMADRQKKNFRNIKKISLKKDEKISLEEEQKIIKLKTSPKAVRSEIPHFIEKQDSDDVLEIVELDESPSRKRKDQLELQEQAAAAAASESTVLVPDEIIEIPAGVDNKSLDRQQTPEPTVSEILEEELKSNPVFAAPPKKTARLRREHVYEDIEGDNGDLVSEEINNILEIASVEALKQSLAKQDSSALKDVNSAKTAIPLDRMGSSEEEVERAHLAPLSSIDSGSSEDERKPHLSPVAEESDAASNDGIALDKEEPEKLQPVPEVIKEPTDHIPWNDIELKPALKKEASPSPSDKKVTFSHVEDEAEPHREDIELPEGLPGIGPKRWSNLR